jgi:CheY-like chemotaxis protein
MNPEAANDRRVGDPMADTNRLAAMPVRKIVVVDGSTDVVGMLEAVLDAGRYDMAFVESSNDAYSQIRKILPNLVILCADVQHLDGLQLLTMLKLDPETRDVPVATCTTLDTGQVFDAVISQPTWGDDGPSPGRRSPRMN